MSIIDVCRKVKATRNLEWMDLCYDPLCRKEHSHWICYVCNTAATGYHTLRDAEVEFEQHDKRHRNDAFIEMLKISAGSR